MKRIGIAEKTFTFVVGSILGASMAILLAPQSGAKTRRKIAKYSKKAGNRAQQFVGDITDSLDGVIGDILEAGSEGMRKGKKLTERARHEILDVMDAGRKYIDEERGKLERLLK